jgi:hypothetical protein
VKIITQFQQRQLFKNDLSYKNPTKIGLFGILCIRNIEYMKKRFRKKGKALQIWM